jgi:hypothetical protein
MQQCETWHPDSTHCWCCCSVGDNATMRNVAPGLYRDSLLSFLLLVVVVSPLLVLLFRASSGPFPDVVVADDPAVIELYTLRATKYEQLLGPYSRFGFHHPGPAMFYILAPFYALSGHRHVGLNIGALASNLVCLSIVLWVPRRIAGVGTMLLSSVPLSFLVLYLQPFLLWNVWNPYFAVLPLALSAACAYAVSVGRWGFMPVGVIAGSVAAQCHWVNVVPLLSTWAAAILTASIGVRRGSLRAPRLVVVGVTAGAGLLLWVPTLAEQLTGAPGNMVAAARFAADSSGKVGPGAALRSLSVAATEAFLSPMGASTLARPEGSTQVFCIALTVLLCAVVVALAVIESRRVHQNPIATIACTAGLLSGGYIALANLTGPLHPHLSQWAVVVGPLVIMFLAMGASHRATPSPLARRAFYAVCAATVLTTSVGTFRSFSRSPSLDAWIDSGWGPSAYGDVWTATSRSMEEARVSRPRIRIESTDAWPYAAALVLQLEKRGVEVVIDEDWEFMFGGRPSIGVEDSLLVVRRLSEQGAGTTKPGIDPPVSVEVTPISMEPVACLAIGDGSSEPYLRRGFYQTEHPHGGPQFRWSRGSRSELVVPLEAGRRYEGAIECAPFPLQPQTLTVIVNRKVVSQCALKRGWQRVSFVVPGEYTLPLNKVELEYSHVVSPSDLGLSKDTRRLAVKYRELCFRRDDALGPEPFEE